MLAAAGGAGFVGLSLCLLQDLVELFAEDLALMHDIGHTLRGEFIFFPRLLKLVLKQNNLLIPQLHLRIHPLLLILRQHLIILMTLLKRPYLHPRHAQILPHLADDIPIPGSGAIVCDDGVRGDGGESEAGVLL